MLKLLFLPFLQIPTGHHTVADALIRSLEPRISNLRCAKVDFFSYADKMLEKAFRLTYLTWIDHSPQTFVWLYRNFVYPTKSTKHFNWYEIKFLDKMKNLISREQPDLIICTQALPSFLLSRLRYSGVATPPIINVYTDFFINSLWGTEGIDYHFVPDKELKFHLTEKQNINPKRIFITGIPIDECFVPNTSYLPQKPYNILISGGSGGLGDIQQLIFSLPEGNDYNFSLLCGNNKKLYKEILALNRSNLKPLPYISSRENMNNLYNNAQAIITKPGGVTISEALSKRLPIFIHSTLPGQEEVNRDYLLRQKLIYPLNLDSPVINQLSDFLENKNEQISWLKRVDEYLAQFECSAWQKIIEIIVSVSLRPQTYRDISAITESSC